MGLTIRGLGFRVLAAFESPKLLKVVLITITVCSSTADVSRIVMSEFAKYLFVSEEYTSPTSSTNRNNRANSPTSVEANMSASDLPGTQVRIQGMRSNNNCRILIIFIV